MTHNQYPQPQDTVDQAQEAVLHDAEVIARTLDMVPAHSELGNYLARPDTKIETGSDGHPRAVDAGHSNYDGIKLSMAKAIDDVSQGKVGRVKLLAGMVNGHIDTHRRDDKNPNLRYAFEQLAHFNITGNAGFHTMLNKSGELVGTLGLGGSGSETSEADAATLAAGAAKIREGHTAVMFNGYNDRPDTKMYGMRDPQSGELLKNSFMLVKSGTFYDKDGTASNFSNMAFAEVVMIPDVQLETTQTTELPEATEVESPVILEENPKQLVELDPSKAQTLRHGETLTLSLDEANAVTDKGRFRRIASLNLGGEKPLALVESRGVLTLIDSNTELHYATVPWKERMHWAVRRGKMPIELTNGENVIGRKPHEFDDPFMMEMPDTVSRKHAVIVYDKENRTVTIQDTSTNGTIVQK